MKYIYEIHDGDDWVPVIEQEFDSAIEAKKAGIDAGFENVRAAILRAEDN